MKMLNQEQLHERATKVINEANAHHNGNLNEAFRNIEFFTFHESFYHDIDWGNFGEEELGEEIALYMGTHGLNFDVTLKGELVSYGRSVRTEMLTTGSVYFELWSEEEMPFISNINDDENEDNEEIYEKAMDLIDDLCEKLEKTEAFKEMSQIWDYILENTQRNETGIVSFK